MAPRMWSTGSLLGIWLPILATTLLHYATGSDAHGVHDVLRRVYYIPIIIAAFRHGLRGGLTASAVTTVAYLPHAFSEVGHHDPASWTEKVLEVALYNIVGAVSGLLASRESAARRKAEVALDQQRTLQEQLVRAGRLAALGEVVAGVAHEVRNPLHALKGSAEFIERELETSRGREMWELHVRELDRLDGVAERFLNFARPAPPSNERVDLVEVVVRAAQLVRSQAEQQGVKVEVAEVSGPLVVVGDHDQLVQVVLNLALNAVQAARQDAEGGGRVSLGLEKSDAGVSVTVDNNGATVDPAERERIFDPFVTRSPGGSGLGLSISARIIEQHQGQLSVGDGPLGTRLWVWLPSE